MLTVRNAFKIFLVTGSTFSMACQNTMEVPGPAAEPEFSQPVNQPLHFTAETKIRWTDSLSIKPSIKKFEFKRLPSKYYDSSGFMPFQKKPEEIHFDLDKLRDTVFNYETLPSIPLRFETTVLEPPRVIKSVHPHIKSGISEFIYEFGDPFIGNNMDVVYADSRGLIWIASRQGLYCYDGENLLEYMSGLAKNPVSAILEDDDGKIWLGTHNNGLFVLDLKSGTKSYVGISMGQKDYSVGNMFLDRQKRIWFATDNHSAEAGNPVFIIDQTTRVMKKLAREQGVANGSGMIQDSTRKIWMGSFGEGINIIDLDKGKIKYLDKTNGLSDDTLVEVRDYNGNGFITAGFHGALIKVDIDRSAIVNYGQTQGFKIEDNIYIRKIFRDRQGNIWICDFGRKRPGFGIEIVDPIRGAIKYINNAEGLGADHIADMTEDRNGQVWVGTKSGLNIIPATNNSLKHIGKDDITTLAEDTHGNIWIGVIGSGIKILDTISGVAKIFNASSGLSSDAINNMDNFNGSIFIETAGGLDMVDSSFSTIDHIGKAQGLAKDTVGHAFKDREGRIWIAGRVGFDMVNMQKDKMFHIGAAQSLKMNTVDYVRQDGEDNLWISNSSMGVCILNMKKNTLRYIDNLPGIKTNNVKFLLPDKQGNMWIGARGGLYMINAKRDSVLWFSKREGLAGDRIISLNKYDNCIYVGSNDGGLTILTPPGFSENNKWKTMSFGKSQGISKNVTTQGSDIITKDGRFMWGDKGISVLRKTLQEQDSVRTYISGIDLLNKPLFFTNKSIPEIYGDTIWSAGKDTFFIRNSSFGFDTYNAQRKMKWDSVYGRYNMPLNLQFPYDENYLQFHFVQESNSPKDTVWYRYILEGIDKKWSDKTFNTSSENYLNLPSGNYIFKATSLSNGKWSEAASFSFRILPPWWKTGWAYSIFSLALIGLVWLFINYRSKQLLRQNRLLEEKVKLRTQELVEEKEKVESTLSELKTTQAQLVQSEKMASLGELTAGIAHEIQNPLNFVNNFSDVNKELLFEMKDEINKGNLKEAGDIADNVIENEQKINHHGRRADAIVKSMLQHSQFNTGKMESADINALADEYLNLAYHGLRAKEKSFKATLKTDYDATIGKVLFIPQDIGRVLLNLYNNAFYAISEKDRLQIEGFQPTVWVATKKKNGGIDISVRDNGNGIPSKVLDKVFQPFFTTKPTGQGTGLGLSLSYDIVKAHRGELKIITKEGEGAEFLIHIPTV
jgi:signal transduction histidine kinase/ligand-binding sensor domain-containing protein